MREIKFRAWHVEEKCFVRDFILDDRGNYYITDHCEYMGDDRKLIIMQFTGLKDKNGKEIYCSDLIKTPAGTGEVRWEDGCYRIYWNHRDNTTLHDTKSEQMEVVGNKYEGLQNAGKGDII